MRLRARNLIHHRGWWEETKCPENWHTWTERMPHHFGDSRCLTWQNRVWVLGMGSSDQYLVAQDLDDPLTLYVLSENTSLGYIGLERLHPDRSTPHSTEHEYSVGDSVFFQDPDDAWSGSPQPKPWSEYAWHTQIRRLAEYLPD